MAQSSIGDLATSLTMRNQNARLKAEIKNLLQTVATGRTASLADTVNGNFRIVSGIEHSLSQATAYESAAAEAAGFTGVLQNTLETIRESASELSRDLMSLETTPVVTQINFAGSNAVATFESVVSALNTRYAGRSLFSGDATDQNALQSADDILASIEGAVATATTAADVMTAVETWFAPGNGFDTTAYTGSATALQPMAVSQDQVVTVGPKASDTEIRDLLKQLALAALVERAPALTDHSERLALATNAGEMLLNSNSHILSVQARIGSAQESIAQARAQNGATKASMELALAEVVAVDPYESATQLEQAEAQLELLYTITARASRLKLMDFI